MLRGLQKWSGLDALDAFLQASHDLRGFALVQAGLDFLQARYAVAPIAADCIPARGRLLIVANHPSGALDALALLDCVGGVRRDVKIVANDFLWALEGLRELLLPVRILGGAPSPASVRAIEQALAQEQCVIVFPAGEVSRLGWGGVADGRWRRGFIRFALRTATQVLPVRIHARNSALFYGASALFKPAGTALLAREMFARRERRIALSLGRARALPQDQSEPELMRGLRRELYALGRAGASAAPAEEALVAAQDPAALAAEIAALRSLGQTVDGKQIRVGRLRAGSALLREIGRLRELTFRAVGEGTGRRLDLDDYDTWYEHIVLWDGAAARVAGAYRVARGAPVLAERGLAGFYTAGLFCYGEAILPRIAAGMELGRSFVVPDYWGSRSIDYLWQGIGAYLRDHPQVRYLFGAVSISAALPRQAREQIVAYYARYYGDALGEAASARPFDYPQAPPAFDALDAETAFKVLKGNLDALGAAVPMLYKQYTELCEPGGARFLAFGVDPAFNDTVDGLIELDLQRIRRKKRVRYLEGPRSEAEVMA
ncbi:GNAT family N-acetyltransferase [Xanthomonas theicola]|uniref:L-ornithine N(alpha)-acyltransferase n=1 Tax=Xanthomonas theicola TaxID=56464 RepID=A0A2S6Z7M3_9XANT|nr:GNAT family N-acetyltransferase [Xanthomonas theicola]QNH27175.1 GNAT family N-acetyltransferase [Xanthomonas theicola]